MDLVLYYHIVMTSYWHIVIVKNMHKRFIPFDEILLPNLENMVKNSKKLDKNRYRHEKYGLFNTELIIANGKSNSDFEPSMKILSRIVRVILERNSIGRTALAQVANASYVTVAKHIEWLHERSLADFKIEDGKTVVILTASGRGFAFQIWKIERS